MVFGSKKQVLLVGNDGVQLYVVSSKRVSLYADFSDAGASLASELRQAFKDVDAPLTILLDVVEQQYRKEVIPKVGFTDKNKVIQRKLQMAFPQQPMRAYLLLKQKGKDDSIQALFAGLSPNLTITQIMDAVIGSEIAVQGAVLLPLESTTLVQKLADASHKKGTATSRWAVLMTYHKTGGLRQVVIKDGELALTRLTPLAVDPSNTVALVEEMAREFSATLTYLSRFGYVASDGLDLTIVSSQDVVDVLGTGSLPVTNLYALTLFEAGKLAGFTPVMAQNAGVYADALHAGWLGIQRKALVPLSAATLDRIKQLRQIAQLVMFVLILGLGYLGWQVFTLQTGNMTMNKDITDLKAKRIMLQNQHDALSKKLNTLKYETEKVRIVLEQYDKLGKDDIKPEPLMALVGSAINRDRIALKSFAIKPFKADLADAAKAVITPTDPNSPDANKEKFEATLVISFIDGMSVEQAARQTNDLVDALKTRLPNWQIEVKQMVGNLAIDKTMQGVSEQVAQGQVEGRMVKEETSTIEMKGALP